MLYDPQQAACSSPTEVCGTLANKPQQLTRSRGRAAEQHPRYPYRRKPMRKPVTVFLSLVVLFGAPASAHAQGIEWETLNAEVMSLYRKGQYDRAVVVAKKELVVAEKALGYR